MHPCVSLFRPALVLALDAYVRGERRALLDDLYGALNTLALSALAPWSYSQKIQWRALGAAPACAPHDTQRVERATRSRRAARDTISAPHSPRHETHHRATYFTFRGTSVPVPLPLVCFPEELGEYALGAFLARWAAHKRTHGSLHPHLHTNGSATHPVTVLFNALVAHKRVLFVGRGARADAAGAEVVAACALASGCGAVLRGIVQHALPYATLIDVDRLAAAPGYVAGTNHPRLAEMPIWDVLCECATGRITVADSMPLPPACVALGPPLAQRRRSWAAPTRRADTPPGWWGDDRGDAPEPAMLHALLHPAHAHRSEPFWRYWAYAYVRDFVARAAQFERHFLPAAPLARAIHAVHAAPPAGIDKATGNELRWEAMRFQGWRASPSYNEYVHDVHTGQGRS